MSNLGSMLKSRDITLPTKVHLVKAMVFPVVTYGCESWTKNTVELWIIDAFELWFWRRLLRVPWTGRRSVNLKGNQSWIFIERSDADHWKVQYFGHLIRRTDLLEKTLMLGKIEGRKRRRQQRMRWLDDITDNGHEFEQAPGVGNGQGSLACCCSRGCKELTGLRDWTELNWNLVKILFPYRPFKSTEYSSLGYLAGPY